MAGSGPAIQVKVGADVRDLKKNLDLAKSLASGTAASMEKSFASTGRSESAQKSLNKEINLGNRMIADMVNLINSRDRAAVQEARNAIAAQRDWMNSVGATNAQYQKLLATKQQLNKAVRDAARETQGYMTVVDRTTGQLTGFGRRGATAFSSVLFSAQALFEGTESGARSALRAVSTFAFAFGAGGIVVSALSAGALAIADYFGKARKEMEETAKKFREQLADMTRSGDMIGKQKIARDIALGDPAQGASRFRQGSFTGGLNDLQGERDSLQSALSGGLPFREARQAAKRLVELAQIIAQKEKLMAAAMQSALGQPSLPTDLGPLSTTVSARSPFARPRAAKVLPMTRAFDSIAGRAQTGRFGAQDAVNATVAKNLERALEPGKLLREAFTGMPGSQATNEKAAAAVERQNAATERLIQANAELRGALVSVGAQFVNAAAGWIANKIGGGQAGGFGASAGGMLGGAMAKKLGSGIGGLVGSVIPGAGTIVGSLAGGLIGAGVGKLFGGLFGHKKKVDKSAASLDKLAESAKRATEQLINVPSGFKVALARHRAAIGEGNPSNAPGAGGTGGLGGTGGSGYEPDPAGGGRYRPVAPGGPGSNMVAAGEVSSIVITGPVYVSANTESELIEKLGKEALQQSRRGGTNQLTTAMARATRAA